MAWFRSSIVRSWWAIRASRPSMRGPAASGSLTGHPSRERALSLRNLSQPVSEGDALIEDEAAAAPAALRLGDFLQVAEDPALELEDLREALRHHEGARLLASDASRAEHRDFPVDGRIEGAAHEIPELAEPGR